MFTDRKEAGKQLAQKLELYRGKDAIVLALPRGGVVPAYEIARALSLPLDIVAVRKIGHPLSPEYAIGAVDESGNTILNETETTTIDNTWLKEETAREKIEAKRRSFVYRGGRKPQRLRGRTVIIVDDGVATGLTMRLAVCVVKKQKPEKIVVAVPVAPLESLQSLKKEGAEVIVLELPERFMGAVGAHYMQFEQVEDRVVIESLQLAHEKKYQDKS